MRFFQRFLVLVLLFETKNAFAQDSTKRTPIEFEFFADLYYAFDFNQPPDHNRPDFVYSHHRHNEFQLNLAYLKVKWSDSTIRANLSLMTGTYAQVNLSHEPSLFRMIHEANIGIRLSKKRKLWLDAGVLPSHIGFESANQLECLNLTRSVLADNSPYYETGIKFNVESSNEKWNWSLLALNGWQRMQRQVGNSAPAFGHQIQWKPSKKWGLNSSSFVGTIHPDSIRKMRYFHNFYAKFEGNRSSFIAGIDYGIEQQAKNSRAYHPWFSLVGIGQYKWNNKWASSLRLEWYSDKHQVQLASLSPVQLLGTSINLDYKISNYCTFRTEIKYWNLLEGTFENQATQNWVWTSSLTFWLK